MNASPVDIGADALRGNGLLEPVPFDDDDVWGVEAVAEIVLLAVRRAGWRIVRIEEEWAA